MKYQSHGDHWDTLFNSHEETIKCVEQNIRGADFLYGRETTFNEDGEQKVMAGMYAIEKMDGPIGIRALIYYDKDEDINRMVSSYPIGRPLDCCKPLCLCHRIDQWDNRIEANIEGETDCEDSRTVNFFSTDYLSHKHVIRLIDKSEYNLVAFGLKCGFPGPDNMELRLEGQKATDFLSKMNRKPVYGENGDVEPVVIGLKDTVSFLPSGKDFPDIVEFRSPVSNVESFTSFGIPMYRMMVTIFRGEPDVCITLYARQAFFDHMPEEGEPVQGFMWLQGEMSSDPVGLLRAEDKPTVESKVSDTFFNIIKEMDFRNFDDLMGLLSPFEDLKTREGYVLDGFWASNNKEFYTKLYFSAAGSEIMYKPEIIEGVAMTKFDDSMYIQNYIEEDFVNDLPELTDYIEGPFTEKAIWEMYLLMTSRYYLPMSKGYENTFRILMTRKLDFTKLMDENYGNFSSDERVSCGVNIIDRDKAIVSCAFWSKDTGLCVEKTVVSRTGNGYRFGKPRQMAID